MSSKATFLPFPTHLGISQRHSQLSCDDDGHSSSACVAAGPVLPVYGDSPVYGHGGPERMLCGGGAKVG